LQIADELAQKDGILIVDEANVDCVPELSVANEVSARENLIVLNGIGKFFGLAGARVSVAITPTAWEEKLQKIIGSWPIATPICLQLPAMFADKNWQTQMRARLHQESQNWREILAEHFTLINPNFDKELTPPIDRHTALDAVSRDKTTDGIFSPRPRGKHGVTTEIVADTPLFTLVECKNSDIWHKKLAENGILVRKFAYNDSWLRFSLPKFNDLQRIIIALNS
jgi:histidinol-phosphate/aromatic aminotransferase/cobyric acid decarboxylase-like protein